jgi:hypothetical protein
MNADDDSCYQELDWSTQWAESVPLEIVIRVVEIAGALTAANLCSSLRWQIYSWGHGDQTHDIAPTMGQAFPPTGGVSVLRQPQWPICARGVVVRLNARRVRMNIRNYLAASSALISASINPLSGPDSDRYPFLIQDSIFAGRSFFPIGAREFRLVPSGGGLLVDFYGFDVGNAPPLFSTQLVTDFVDWYPIDQSWFSYVTPAGTNAEYR